jgi:major membrane immunogen (membrane-anchored lipoprotein)
MRKIVMGAAAIAAVLSLGACGGPSVDGTVQSKSSHHDKKGDSYTVTLRTRAGKTATLTVSSKTFRSCDVGETYSKCRKG